IIAGENQPSPSSFVQDTPGSAASADASGRATTTAEVDWVDAAEWVEGQSYESPDITPVLQEVLNIDGWGGSVVLLVRPSNPDAGGDPDVDVPGRAAAVPSVSLTIEFVPMPVPPA